MPSQSIVPSTVFSVFILEKWVPYGTSVYDICSATERCLAKVRLTGPLVCPVYDGFILTDVAIVSILTKVTKGMSLGNKTILLEKPTLSVIEMMGSSVREPD